MRGGGHKDLPATAAAHFTDSRSYVRLDGKRFLFGDDIEQLRRRVFERDGYRCWGERTFACMGCMGNGCEDCEGMGHTSGRCNRTVTWESGHAHHVIARGRMGDDSASNLVTLCPECHSALHVRPHFRWMGAA